MIRECTKFKPEMELLKLGEKESFELNCPSPSVEFDEMFFELRFKYFFADNCKVFLIWQEEIPVAYIALELYSSVKHARISSIFVLEKYR